MGDDADHRTSMTWFSRGPRTVARPESRIRNIHMTAKQLSTPISSMQAGCDLVGSEKAALVRFFGRIALATRKLVGAVRRGP